MRSAAAKCFPVSPPNPDGLEVAYGSHSTSPVDIRIGTVLLTVVLIPSLAAAGQRPDEDREERATYSPITSSERAAWVAGEIASVGALSRAAFTSAWMTRENRPKEWSRTARGYGRRFGDAQAATAISSSVEAGLGSFWGEDPRYFRSDRPRTLGAHSSRGRECRAGTPP